MPPNNGSSYYVRIQEFSNFTVPEKALSGASLYAEAAIRDANMTMVIEAESIAKGLDSGESAGDGILGNYYIPLKSDSFQPII